MRREDYADSAQAREWDRPQLPAVSHQRTGGDTFAEACRKKREREAEEFKPRLAKALDQMEAFFNGRKA